MIINFLNVSDITVSGKYFIKKILDDVNAIRDLP